MEVVPSGSIYYRCLPLDLHQAPQILVARGEHLPMDVDQLQTWSGIHLLQICHLHLTLFGVHGSTQLEMTKGSSMSTVDIWYVNSEPTVIVWSVVLPSNVCSRLVWRYPIVRIFCFRIQYLGVCGGGASIMRSVFHVFIFFRLFFLRSIFFSFLLNN